LSKKSTNPSKRHSAFSRKDQNYKRRKKQQEQKKNHKKTGNHQNSGELRKLKENLPTDPPTKREANVSAGEDRPLLWTERGGASEGKRLEEEGNSLKKTFKEQRGLGAGGDGGGQI